MLVYETRGIVDLVVYNNEEILLAVVFGHVRVGVFLVGRHADRYVYLLRKSKLGAWDVQAQKEEEEGIRGGGESMRGKVVT